MHRRKRGRKLPRGLHTHQNSHVPLVHIDVVKHIGSELEKVRAECIVLFFPRMVANVAPSSATHGLPTVIPSPLRRPAAPLKSPAGFLVIVRGLVNSRRPTPAPTSGSHKPVRRTRIYPTPRASGKPVETFLETIFGTPSPEKAPCL